jgi:hypothetical protein
MIKLPKQPLDRQPSPGKFFGNKDTAKKYELRLNWIDSVVIRESIETQIGPLSTDVAEIPSSVLFKPFDKSLFDTHVEQGMFDKHKVEIIHDPRKL